MITLKQLRYLSALAEHRHFGKAAEACAVTQPALSMQIRDLEKDLGADLVERRPGEVILTETGAEVARRAERVLAAARDLTEFARHSGRLMTGLLRLGVIPTLAPYVLPQILPALQAALSGIAHRAARDANPHADGGACARRARRGAARAAGGRTRHRNAHTVRRPVPARGPGGRRAQRKIAHRCARHRPAAAYLARRRPLPARSGAGVLRHRAARPAVGIGRHLAIDRDADGGEWPWRDAVAAHRASRRGARHAREDVALPRAGARTPDRACLAPHLAAQSRISRRLGQIVRETLAA